MDAYKIVKNDIEAFIRKALHLRLIQNPRIGGNFFSHSYIISSKHTFFADEADYLKRYYSSYENNEYFLNLMDGSFFQINYEFKRVSKHKSYLEKMNLCYLPNIIEEQLINHYIRVDYDETTKNSFFHPVAHVHIGFGENLRIPLSEVMLFSEFFEFITYCFYHDDYKTYLGNDFPNNMIHNISEGKLTKKTVLAQEFLRYMYLKIKD